VHSFAGRLNGMQPIQSRLNHLWNQRGVSSAAVQHYFQPVSVPQSDQALQVRKDEPPEQAGAHHWTVLCSKVVADKENVECGSCGVENALAYNRVEIHDV